MNKQCLCTLAFWLFTLITLSNALAEENGEQHHPTNRSSVDIHQPEKILDFTLRLGQGGFRDSRSPIGKLGGGQLALDIRPHRYPVALSLSGEYYTNGPAPTHPYEIADLTVVNLLYMTQIFNSERMTFFLGGGIGRLEVPKGESEPDEMVHGTVYNLEAGVRVRLFWRLGMYGVGKYLYANKTMHDMTVIDFSEGIVLLGLTLNFSL